MEQNGSCQLDLTKLVFAGLQQLYNNPLFSDVTIICPDDTQLHCHQCVLASASKQFADLFKSGEVVKGLHACAHKVFFHKHTALYCLSQVDRLTHRFMALHCY